MHFLTLTRAYSTSNSLVFKFIIRVLISDFEIYIGSPLLSMQYEIGIDTPQFLYEPSEWLEPIISFLLSIKNLGAMLSLLSNNFQTNIILRKLFLKFHHGLL